MHFGGRFLWLVLVSLLVFGKQNGAQAMGEKAVTLSQHGCEFFIILIKNTQSAFTAHATVAIGKVQNELLT